MKTYNEFKQDNSSVFIESEINEGLFDKLSNMFSKITGMFKDKAKLAKGVDVAMQTAGKKSETFLPKTIKNGETYLVTMGDPKVPAKNFTISFTKLADLPDGTSSLFSITGSTSPEMLKALIGSDKVEDLGKNNVMAIIPISGFIKGKVATMRIVKNIIPGGKDYVTKAFVIGSVSGLSVEKALPTIK